MVNKEFTADWVLRAQKIAHLGLWDQSPKTNDLWWSDETYRILGLEPQSIAPSFDSFLQLVHPDDRESITTLTELLLKSDDTPYIINYRIIRPDGFERIVHEEAIVERDSSGNPTKITGIIQDVTERKTAEKALKESEFRFRSVVETATDAIVVCDGQGKISTWNKSAERLFGFSVEEMIGGNITKIIPEHLREKHSAGIARVAAGGEKKIIGDTVEILGLHKDSSEIPVELSLNISSVEGNIQFTGIIRDISQRKKEEEERLKLQDQLHNAHKMEAIGTMAGGIAHNFNNMLGVILGYTDMAHEDIPDENPVKGYLKKVITAAQKAKKLVEHIVTFSHQPSSVFNSINPSVLLLEYLTSMKEKVSESITIKETISPNTRFVNIHSQQFNVITDNLCLNALDAMQDQGGTLTLKLEEIELKSIDLQGELDVNPGHFVKLTVSDTGHGITQKDLVKIFDPFFTTKKVGEGDGIGLSVTQGIVRKTGGIIKAESEVGKGSDFHVFLPAVENISNVNSHPASPQP